jgi:hypothetical protein
VAGSHPLTPLPLLHVEKRIIMAADGPPADPLPLLITVAYTSGIKFLKSYNYQNIHPN